MDSMTKFLLRSIKKLAESSKIQGILYEKLLESMAESNPDRLEIFTALQKVRSDAYEFDAIIEEAKRIMESRKTPEEEA